MLLQEKFESEVVFLVFIDSKFYCYVNSHVSQLLLCVNLNKEISDDPVLFLCREQFNFKVEIWKPWPSANS